MKKRTERDVILAAIVRGLDSVRDENDRPQHTYQAGEINGWKADALASYVIQKVMRALQRRRHSKKASKK